MTKKDAQEYAVSYASEFEGKTKDEALKFLIDAEFTEGDAKKVLGFAYSESGSLKSEGNPEHDIVKPFRHSDNFEKIYNPGDDASDISKEQFDRLVLLGHISVSE